MEEFEYIVGLDIETTGLDKEKDSIIEIGAVVWKDGKEEKSFSQTVFYDKSLPEFIRKLTGIAEKELKKSPPIQQVIKEFSDFLPPQNKTIIIGHNIKFDTGFIEKHMPEIANYQTIDTLILSRIAFPDSPYHSLEFLIHKLRIKTDHHRALSDAITSCNVFDECSKIIKKYPDDILAIWTDKAIHPSYRWYFNSLRPGTDTIDLIFNDNHIFKEGSMPLDIDMVFEKISEKYPEYENRMEQKIFAENVDEVIKDGGILLVEAGTGTGKSFGYLVPAIVNSNHTGNRVVITTGTKALQQQLFYKDIKEIADYAGISVKSTLIKGRENYACKLRLKEVLDNPTRFANTDISNIEYYSLFPLYYWQQKTIAGDLEELGLSGISQFTKKYISASSSVACNDKCPFINKCYLMRARAMAKESAVVISNTALTLIDSLQNFNILGDFDTLIIDEAHKIEDVATEQWKYSFNTDNIMYWNNTYYVKSRRNFRGKWDDIIEVERKIKEIISNLTEWKTDFIRNQASKSKNSDTGGIIRSEYVPDDLFRIGYLHEIKEKLDRVLAFLSKLAEDEKDNLPLKIAYDELFALSENFSAVINNEKNRIYWYESMSSRDGKVVLNSVPLNIGNYLSEFLFDKIDSIILTSATLTVDSSYDFFKMITGINKRENVREVMLDSPFDFDKQMNIIILEEMPYPASPDFYRIMADIVESIIGTGKGSLVLTTGYEMINAIENKVTKRKDRHIMFQRRGANADAMMRMFREDKDSVLVGTATFWEGIDVKGNSLEILFITKLPFDVPTDPVIKARGSMVGDSFNRYMLPRAVIKMRQGIGRLIRSKKDKGYVIIADSRLITKYYGKTFINSFPTEPKYKHYRDFIDNPDN